MKIKLNVAVDNYGDKDDVIEVPTFIGEAWTGNGTASVPSDDVTAHVDEDELVVEPADEDVPEDEPEKKKKVTKKATEETETADAVVDDIETR